MEGEDGGGRKGGGRMGEEGRERRVDDGGGRKGGGQWGRKEGWGEDGGGG